MPTYTVPALTGSRKKKELALLEFVFKILLTTFYKITETELSSFNVIIDHKVTRVVTFRCSHNNEEWAATVKLYYGCKKIELIQLISETSNRSITLMCTVQDKKTATYWIVYGMVGSQEDLIIQYVA